MSHQSRVGWAIAGASLLFLIISVCAGKFIPGLPHDIWSVGVVGVLSGIIIVLARKPGTVVAPRDPSKPSPLVDVLGISGIIVIIHAFASSLHGAIGSSGMGLWTILVVVLILSAFEFWAMFWGPEGRSFLAFRGIIQFVLFLAIFVAAGISHRQHFSSEKSHYLYYQKTPDETKARTASDEAKKELASGHPDRALRLFDEAIRLEPKDPDAYVGRGRAYVELGQTARAIQDFDEAIRLDPKNTAAYDFRGDAYKKLGQIQRAMSDYDQAIKLAPTEALYYVDRGNAYLDLGKPQRAIEDYGAAIRIDQKDAGTYFNRALAYNKLGQQERAIQDYSEAIRLNPNYVEAYENRGWTYQALGKTKQAQSDFDKAKKLRAAR
jgi:Tfp pilus assembly protein PilF